ncbi:mitochondrial carrier protein [Klosneuvirus KNV1]|uniref:Mitochondrial carrier protein n=1 Tax=Klosneuvirus KNV1 TaxID=1977640 RepID=A0A1V0SK54_9VIRU|nr:mitochondrial carrier protein [Klosneuvirus KNV1]
MEESWKHFAHGALSGAVGVTLSHPFDTIKTCIQDKKPKPTNFRGLYKGFTSPLFGVGLEKSIVFGVYTNTQKTLDKNRFAIPIAGAVSGFCASFIVTPVEKIKILLQTDQKVKMNQLTPKYLFHGLSATFTRETPGFAIYFSFYENMKQKIYGKNITTVGSFVLGGLAGSLAWCFIYPQDCIKTRMQAHNDNKKFMNVVREIYTEGGLSRFYKGFGYALMRAVPLHAGTFMTMELLKKYE